MAEYAMQEMNLPNSEGEQVLYPRMVLNRQVDTAYIAKRLASQTTFTAAEVIGLLMGLSDELSFHLAEGSPVKLEGIGIFTPALALHKGKERETGEEGEAKRNAQSIYVGGVNFRPEKSLLKDINRQCELERSKGKFKRSSQKYTPEQRLELAKQYLDSHPFMRIADYAAITGLRKTAASIELKQWLLLPDSGIATSGRGTHKVYVKKPG